MVEKKEFAIIFENELNDDNTMTFTPVRVIEGKFDSEYSWFLDSEEKIPYIHIEQAPEHVLGFANRVIINFDKYSISKEKLEAIKKELLENAKEYVYATNPINDCVIATHKVTGDEYLVDNYEDEITKETKNEQAEIELTMTPLEIESKIKETIKGQDEAVRKIVTALWTTLKFRNMRKKNMLIIGPSGVGKTAIFEKVKKILNIPVVIFSVPGLSQAGYVGRSTDEILKQVYYESVEDLDLAEKSIIILDEIDKIAQRGEGDVSTAGVQNELLKIIEGCTRYIESSFPGEPGFEMDTSKMIFIGTGAFQELHDEKKKTTIGFGVDSTKEVTKTDINTDKLIKYGLKRELVGRLPIVVELKSLGKEELKDIILNSDESELIATSNALKELGVEIANLDEAIDYIVEDAIKNQLGARGLILTINNLFQEIFYEVGNNPDKYSKVVLGENIIKDKFDFKLIRKKAYTKKRINIQKG